MQATHIAQQPQLFEWPELEVKSNWTIFYAVLMVHLLALLAINFSSEHITKKPVTKKIMVRTVTLGSPSKSIAPKQVTQKKAAPAPAPAPAPVAEVKKESISKESIPAEKPVQIEKEIVAEAPPAAVTKKEPASKPKPVSKSVSKPEPVKPVAKVEKKPTPKPAVAKTKPAEVKKQAVKKETSKPKPVDNTKAKDAKAKEQKAAADKAAKEKAAKDKEAKNKAAKESAAKEKAAKEKAERAQAEKQNALLNQALSSLDSSGRIDGKKSSLAASAAKHAATSGPAAISSLSAESLVAIDASETANCTPGERTYYDELVSRLKLALKLPEYGEVKLELTISRTGKVETVKSVKSKSSKNSDYVKKALPKLHLPPFGQNFPGEKDHTFRLTLSNELNY
ncbi:MAG: hypothetical protein LLF94_10130 [Chlamydiales bacterium]|nr:hypothetical protein [Chlamydiales bacterium]